MKIINADCIEYAYSIHSNVLIPHVTNDIGAWGSGFVLALSKKWPMSLKERSPEFEYRRDGQAKSLGFCQFCEVESSTRFSICVANMCAQHSINGKSTSPDDSYSNRVEKPIRYSYLLDCMRSVRRFCIDNNAQIVCPKFGSDRAGGNWDLITELIEEVWDGIDVTVCCLPIRKKS